MSSPSPIAIRPPRERDAEAFISAARASKRLHGRWVKAPQSVEEYRAYLHRMQPPMHCPLLAEHLGQQELIGVFNLSQIVLGAFCSANLGYYAFAGQAGKGRMSEALSLVLKHAFGPLGLHRVEANIQPDNHGSIALVQRAGFRREGYSPRYLKINGRWRDHERWALLAEEFSRRS